jgi:hypothetical protein
MTTLGSRARAGRLWGRITPEHWDGAAAGGALTWLGGEVLPGLRSLPDPAGQPDAHAVASRYLATLDDHLAVAAQGWATDEPRSVS